jgi:hypothetical protein
VDGVSWDNRGCLCICKAKEGAHGERSGIQMRWDHHQGLFWMKQRVVWGQIKDNFHLREVEGRKEGR